MRVTGASGVHATLARPTSRWRRRTASAPLQAGRRRRPGEPRAVRRTVRRRGRRRRPRPPRPARASGPGRSGAGRARPRSPPAARWASWHGRAAILADRRVDGRPAHAARYAAMRSCARLRRGGLIAAVSRLVSPGRVGAPVRLTPGVPARAATSRRSSACSRARCSDARDHVGAGVVGPQRDRRPASWTDPGVDPGRCEARSRAAAAGSTCSTPATAPALVHRPGCSSLVDATRRLPGRLAGGAAAPSCPCQRHPWSS